MPSVFDDLSQNLLALRNQSRLVSLVATCSCASPPEKPRLPSEPSSENPAHSQLFLQLRQIVKSKPPHTDRLSFECLQQELDAQSEGSERLLVARLLVCQQLLFTRSLLAA